MKRIRVEYFAMLREQAGRHEEEVATNAPTAAALYRELCSRYSFTLGAEQMKVAINDDFAGWDTPLVDGARVVFVPPIAGG